ncbi:MAG: glutamate--tRNA ligase [Candidatus Kariarchaeaceae archaeon]
MDSNNLLEIIKIETLANSIQFDGVANQKAVIGRIMAKYPSARAHGKQIKESLPVVATEIELLTLDQQKEELQKLDPELFEQLFTPKTTKKEHREKGIADLPNAEHGKVILRCAPDPSKYPHIGHGLTWMINYLLKVKYDGKLILRFDDTNPRKVKTEFYQPIISALDWMGIKYDEIVYASDKIPLLYDKALFLIEQGQSFMCNCPSEKSKELREKGNACECRSNSVSDNLEKWQKLLSNGFKEGEYVLRLKGDLKSKNSVMRDPVLFRVVEAPHCRQGDKYTVWPLYDFESAVLEGEIGTTHVLRSSEFGTMRVELQSYIMKLLGYPIPEFIQYSRFNIIGFPVKGRLIRKLIDEGHVSGWDDLRLITILAMRKRGFHPQLIKDLVHEVGFTSSKTTIDFRLIEAINRKIIDPTTRRLFFVPDPVLIKVNNAPLKKSVDLSWHPTDESFGTRNVLISNEFYLPSKELSKLTEGDVFRLKDLYNVEIIEIDAIGSYICEYKGEDLIPHSLKLQWVPANDFVKVEATIPHLLLKDKKIDPNSLEIQEGYAESTLKTIKKGEILQFERWAFIRVNDSDQKQVYVSVVH